MVSTAQTSSKPAPRSHGLADKLGVFAASACAVHCLAAPVLLAFAPFMGSLWASPATHWVFAAVSIPAALSLLLRNSRGRKGRRGIMGLAIVGAFFVVVGLAAPGASWSQGKGLDVPVPAAIASYLEAPREHGCEDECCASVHAHEGGAPSLFVPFASLVTMLGGVLLVTAHVVSMRGRPACGTAH